MPRVDADVGGRSDAAASVSSFTLPSTSAVGFARRVGCAQRSSSALNPVKTTAPTKRPIAARTMPPCS